MQGICVIMLRKIFPKTVEEYWDWKLTKARFFLNSLCRPYTIKNMYNIVRER